MLSESFSPPPVAEDEEEFEPVYFVERHQGTNTS
jgi:hypothetical protein